MRAFVLAAIAVLASGCPEKKDERKVAVAAAPTVADFWKWFGDNEVRLADAVNKDPVAVMDEIQRHVDPVAKKGVIVEIAIEADAGRHGLVVSADGKKDLFPEVKRLAEPAPEGLKRWIVVPFRPRQEAAFDIQIEGRKITVDDFFFRELGRANGKIDVELAVRGMTKANHDDLVRAGFLLLDSVVGEYDAETKIGGIDFVAAPEKPGPELKPLPELAAAVDSLKPAK